MIKQDGQPAAPPAAEEIEEDAPEAGAETLLELMLAEGAERAEEERASGLSAPAVLPERIEGVLIGRLAAIDERGEPVVTFEGAPEQGFAARAMAALGAGDVGCEVALMFEGGNPRRPVVMGRMAVSSAARREARVDGARIELSAERELVLRCGKASITLTRAGKILIRGAYLLSRSSGTNRIQGGSVQIN